MPGRDDEGLEVLGMLVRNVIRRGSRVRPASTDEVTKSDLAGRPPGKQTSPNAKVDTSPNDIRSIKLSEAGGDSQERSLRKGVMPELSPKKELS